jgi:hypothetical protein
VDGYVGARVFGPKRQAKQVAGAGAKGAALISGVIGVVAFVMVSAMAAGRSATVQVT